MVKYLMPTVGRILITVGLVGVVLLLSIQRTWLSPLTYKEVSVSTVPAGRFSPVNVQSVAPASFSIIRFIVILIACYLLACGLAWLASTGQAGQFAAWFVPGLILMYLVSKMTGFNF